MPCANLGRVAVPSYPGTPGQVQGVVIKSNDFRLPEFDLDIHVTSDLLYLISN